MDTTDNHTGNPDESDIHVEMPAALLTRLWMCGPPASGTQFYVLLVSL